MRNIVRAGLTFVAAGMLVAGVGYGTASASDQDSVTGDGSFALGDFKFHGQNKSDDQFKSTGDFEAKGPGLAKALIALKGPITCLNVEGNRAGFLYPVEKGSTPFLLEKEVVKISLEDGGDTDHIGFEGPFPAAAFDGCAPSVTPFPVNSGNVTVHDAG
jgi:hypothetical protein